MDLAAVKRRSPKPVIRAPVSGAAEVASAVAAARRAFDEGGWRWTKGSVRAAALLKLADILEERSRPISELSQSNPKPSSVRRM